MKAWRSQSDHYRDHVVGQADFKDDAAVWSMQHTTGLQLPARLLTTLPLLPASAPSLNKQHYKKVKSRVSGKNLHSNVLIKS